VLRRAGASTPASDPCGSAAAAIISLEEGAFAISTIMLFSQAAEYARYVSESRQQVEGLQDERIDVEAAFRTNADSCRWSIRKQIQFDRSISSWNPSTCCRLSLTYLAYSAAGRTT